MHLYGPGTALLVVDVQNDFSSPRGSLYVHGAEEIIPIVNDEIREARMAGAPIVYTQDWHPEHTPHFRDDGGVWPVHCVHDSWGAAFPSELVIEGEVVRKGTTAREGGYSGFSGRGSAHVDTGLERLLHESGVMRIVIVGLATEYCVKETALDAVRLGFDAIVVRQAVRPVERDAGDGERALEEMAKAGVVLD